MLTTADKRAAFKKSAREPAASSSPIRSMSAAPRRCSISASRRWHPPAPALPGRSARPTTASPSTTSAIISPRSAAAVDIPVNADFEGGFADEPDKVGANVARAVKTGVAGLSIEDSTGDNAKPLFELELAIERIRAARKAIDADNSGVLLTGRCEAFLAGQADITW